MSKSKKSILSRVKSYLSSGKTTVEEKEEKISVMPPIQTAVSEKKPVERAMTPEYIEIFQLKRRAGKFLEKTTRPLAHQIITNIPQEDEFVPWSLASDLYFQKQLKRKKYSFTAPLIIRNPFRLAPLTAMILFNTEVDCRIRYTVCGSIPFSEIEEGPGKDHRLCILGLYPDCNNEVVLEQLGDANQVIATVSYLIQTKPLPKLLLENDIEITKKTTKSVFPFVFVYGGDARFPFAYDEEGIIRYYIKRQPKPYGLFFLSNGHFLFSETDILMPSYSNPHSTKMLEMDYFGRVFRVYQVENGLHHDASEFTQGGNLIACCSTLADGNEDMVVEIDRKTGNIVKELRLGDIFDDTTYKTSHDWAHLNTVSYNQRDHSILVCLRNLHTVAKIDWESGKLLWILCHPSFWANTPLSPYVLSAQGEVGYSFQAHAAYELMEHLEGDENCCQVIIYDNHWHKRRPVPFFDDDENSYVRIYTIDEKNKTVCTYRNFACEKSKIRSNAIFLSKQQRILAMSGYLEPQRDGFLGIVNEFDFESGKLLNQTRIRRSYYRAYGFTPKYKELCSPMEIDTNYMLGSQRRPSILTEEIDFSAAKSIEECLNYGINGEASQKDSRGMTAAENPGQTYTQDSAQEREQDSAQEHIQKYAQKQEMTLIFKGTKVQRAKNYRKHIKENGTEFDLMEDLRILEFRCMEDILYVKEIDHLIDRLYFKGEQHTYVQRYTDTTQSTPELFSRMVYEIAIPFGHLEPDCYQIYIESRGELFLCKEHIELQLVAQ